MSLRCQQSGARPIPGKKAPLVSTGQAPQVCAGPAPLCRREIQAGAPGFEPG
jgi:hypothetical protein